MSTSLSFLLFAVSTVGVNAKRLDASRISLAERRPSQRWQALKQEVHTHHMVHNFLPAHDSRCVKPGIDFNTDLPEGDANPGLIDAAIKATGPWRPEKFRSDKYGPFNMLPVGHSSSGCRSHLASDVTPEEAEQDCATVCHSMEDACEVFTLYTDFRAPQNSMSTVSSSLVHRCCFGRMYAGERSREQATCYRKKNTKGKEFLIKDVHQKLLGVPINLNKLGRAKDGRNEKLDGWDIVDDDDSRPIAGYEHCRKKGEYAFLDKAYQKVDASKQCRSICKSLRTSKRVDWEEPLWCEGFAVHAVDSSNPLGGEFDPKWLDYQCCLFTHIGSHTGVPMWDQDYGAEMYIAAKRSECDKCEYDCDPTAIEGGPPACSCPGRMEEAPGTHGSVYVEAVFVGDTCSWCRPTTSPDGEVEEKCVPVDTCIDNLPGCEGECIFDWKTFRPRCVCGKGFIAKGTQCFPRGCGAGADVDSNRCPSGTLNPCKKQDGGRCLSSGLPRAEALGMCKEMKAATAEQAWRQNHSELGLVKDTEAAVMERVDACGKGEFIWCCGEFDKDALALQVKQGEGNFAEFRTWAPQVARITATSVKSTLKFGLKLADGKKSAEAVLKSLTRELDQVSTTFQIAMSLCDSGRLPACAAAGRGGVKGFAQHARTTGRLLLAYSRRIKKIMEYIQYDTSSDIMLRVLKYSTEAQRLLEASWRFILKHKWKLLLVVVISTYSLVLVNGMLATASLQLSTNALVAQSFLRHVATRIVCPLLGNPVVQGFLLKWVVQNVLFHPVVVNALDQGLAVMGPFRKLMSKWLEWGGATFSLKDNFEQMKEHAGKMSVVIYITLSALGNTLFNVLVSLLCGAASVLTDAVSSGEKIGSETAGVVSRTWDAGFRKMWNGLHYAAGGEQTKDVVAELGSLTVQMNALRQSAGQVPLQRILVAASKGLLTFESFSQSMGGFAAVLVGATGVMTYFGKWLGGLVPSVLGLLGIRAGQFDGDDDIENVEAEVTHLVKDSVAALDVDEVEDMKKDLTTEQVLQDISFDRLCSILSSAEQTVKKLKDPVPRAKACPSVDNDLLNLLRPNEVQMPLFTNIDVDIPPLW